MTIIKVDSDDILSQYVSYKIYIQTSDWAKKNVADVTPVGYVIITYVYYSTMSCFIIHYYVYIYCLIVYALCI